MNRNTILVFACAFGCAILLQTSTAHAWDEDTCGPTYGDQCTCPGANDPNPCAPGEECVCPKTSSTGTCTTVQNLCAETQPLEGKDTKAIYGGKQLVFDHSTAHWEMTYLIARCVGLAHTLTQNDTSTDYARLVAAADQATDMSSPYCGSSAVVAAKGEELYLNGYACGYEPGTETDKSAVLFYDKPLRLKYTDRCDEHTAFFHYPYRIAGKKQSGDPDESTLVALEKWAFGDSQTLIEQSSSTKTCDMAAGTCAYKMSDPPDLYNTAVPLNQSCSKTKPCSSGRCSNGQCVQSSQVCSHTFTSTTSEWEWPKTSSQTVDWSNPTEEDFKRLGIYLHAAGDYYSHLACQQLSGLPTLQGTTYLTLTAGTDPSDHVNYTNPCDTANVNTSDPNAQTAARNKCYAACSFDAHTCEFGSTTGDEDITGAGTPCGDADDELRLNTQYGLYKIWDVLQTAAKRTLTGHTFARTARYTIINEFKANLYSKNRQEYVKRQLATLPTTWPNTLGMKPPCACDDGLWGWVKGANKNNSGRSPYCCKEERRLPDGTLDGVNGTYCPYE